MNPNELHEAWDRLNKAIQSVVVASVSSLSTKAADMEAARREFDALYLEYFCEVRNESRL